ncbi:mechanosensitive ion channel family protein [Arenicella xantha]|uniref:Small-conductance mechanosensitive channel n=1 Tax=Arenicella xantha TaxID=644221 RepID=A0A395JSA0_9GAMM|nr:mechanosensitive ion channel domain-containing protein [Arenicella xantha]RBP53336.1 small conductance mechanosensitive channel [Arenicella xantha]
MDLNLDTLQKYSDLFVEYGSIYAWKIVLALIIFLVGKRVARIVTNLIVKGLRKNGVEQELIGFFDSLFYWGLFLVVLIAALGQLGIETASFIAVLGAAGLAVGLALQGSLSNFAAGVLIIMLRPFRVGEVVDIAGEIGTVQFIKIFTTELRTGDNKCVIIPNSRVLASNIINYSSTGTRRVDMVFGIGYEADIDHARSVIKSILDADERVMDEPAPKIAIMELADSSVNFVVRPWVATSDYWPVLMDTHEQIKKRFDEEGISIPFPQRVVTMVKDD